MGTIAARDCLRVLELTEQVAAAMLIAARQGMALRARVLDPSASRHRAAARVRTMRSTRASPLVVEDRALIASCVRLLDSIRARNGSVDEA